MKNTFLKLTRTGTFEAEFTANQCFKKGWPLYTYEVVCAVTDKLDNNGFTIDHDEINKEIEETVFEGSCEEMHIMLHDIIKELSFAGKMIAFKTVIKPAGAPEAKAHMEKYWFDSKNSLAPIILATL